MLLIMFMAVFPYAREKVLLVSCYLTHDLESAVFDRVGRSKSVRRIQSLRYRDSNINETVGLECVFVRQARRVGAWIECP